MFSYWSETILCIFVYFVKFIVSFFASVCFSSSGFSRFGIPSHCCTVRTFSAPWAFKIFRYSGLGKPKPLNRIFFVGRAENEKMFKLENRFFWVEAHNCKIVTNFWVGLDKVFYRQK